jgi:hypothetical protein
MTMHPVISTNVLAVGYDPQTYTLRVRFRSGGTYDYYAVSPYLFEQIARTEPVASCRSAHQAHNYTKVA